MLSVIVKFDAGAYQRPYLAFTNRCSFRYGSAELSLIQIKLHPLVFPSIQGFDEDFPLPFLIILQIYGLLGIDLRLTREHIEAVSDRLPFAVDYSRYNRWALAQSNILRIILRLAAGSQEIELGKFLSGVGVIGNVNNGADSRKNGQRQNNG